MTARITRFTPTIRNLLSAAAIAAAFVAGGTTLGAQGFASSERGAVALSNALNSLGNTSRVLVIGAHPDDEDTQLIAWLTRGRHVETAYLSLTRGDGGQNLLGNELGEALGIIRTEELLAARRIDGGRQFFTRAFDFGFSKNADETLEHWPRDSIMGDVIRVVRAFRPQVIVAIFTGTPRDGHGHHQVSGILAREAYDVSADTVRFPTRNYGTPWTVSKFYRRARTVPEQTIVMNVGEYDPLVGRSFSEIAADSRSQHKSQGFGQLQQKGAIIDQLGREATRVGPANAMSELSIFDGIDTTWARLSKLSNRRDVQAALDSAGRAFVEARAMYRANDPTPVVTALAHIVDWLRTARDSSGPRPPRLIVGPAVFSRARFVNAQGLETSLAETAGAKGVTVASAPAAAAELWNAANVNLERAERALMLAAGVAIEVTAPRQTLPVIEAAKRDVKASMDVNVAVFNRGRTPVRYWGAVINGFGRDSTRPTTIAPDSVLRVVKPATASEITQSWWRITPRNGGWFTREVDSRDDAERAADFQVRATVHLEIAGVRVDVNEPVVNRIADPVKGELNIAVAAVPGIAIGLVHDVEYIRANVPVTRQLRVNVLSSYTSAETVSVSLVLPKGLKADTAIRERVLTPESPGTTILFNLKGVVPPGRFELGAIALHKARPSGLGYYTISYDHIPPQRMYKPSGLWLEAVEVVRPLRARVAYIQGVGDQGIDALQQLDIPVERIEPGAIPSTDFSKFSAVIVGPRAYAASEVLAANNARLLDYAKKGGTLVVQYGQTEMMRPGIMPFPIQLSRTAERVTMEQAPVTITASGSRLLNSPNKIGPKDWEGWVQERALYMPTTFDKNYSSLLEMNDPGEPVNKAGILVAPYGKGTYVYVTLSLFRQLPAGVPGAARLLMNIISSTPSTATPPRMEE